MKATVYLSRKLLNQLKVKKTESKDLMLTHNLHNIIINGKRVGCSGHIQTFSTISAFTSALKRVAISPCLTRTWFAMPPV